MAQGLIIVNVRADAAEADAQIPGGQDLRVDFAHFQGHRPSPERGIARYKPRP